MYLAPDCPGEIGSLFDYTCVPGDVLPPPQPPPPAPTCAAASTGCPAGATAYSCTGSATPSADGGSTECEEVQTSSSATLFCCVQDTCVTDPASAGNCTGGTAYACGGAARVAGADAGNLTTCTPYDAPEGSTGVTGYCCQTATCTQEYQVVSCPTGIIGYSCSAPATPDLTQNDLACPYGASGGPGGVPYCCTPILESSCSTDYEVSCATGQFGYSCEGATPADVGSTLDCTAVKTLGDTSTGKTEYCCDAPATCSDTAGVGCTGNSVGWMCTGSNMPSAATCGTPVAVGTNVVEYCCTPY